MRRLPACGQLGIAIGGVVLFGASLIHAQNPPNAPALSFEVASIKPNDSGSGIVLFTIHSPGRFAVANASLKTLIAWAYNTNGAGFQLSDDRILGGPSWISTEKYDVEAEEDNQTVERLEKLPPGESNDQIKLMVQSLLTDRFRLRVHDETRDLPVYALVVAKGGPKMTASTKESSLRFRTGEITATAATTSGIAAILSRQAPTGCAPPELEGREVRDETGLSGVYDFTLKWTPEARIPIAADSENPFPPEASGPSVFTALEEQLGLRLESAKGPVDVLVIDHIEEPTPN